ncbi:hypothetical protein TrRE_jg917, partial [Triparma retinervis]
MELKWRQQHSQSEIYPFSSSISVDPPITLSLSIRQKQCGEQDGTGTGAVVWNAAHMLCAYLTKRHRGGDNIFAVTSVVEYWWGSETLPKSSFDIVLVADCILPKLYPMEPLVAAISSLLTPTGVCFVSYEHRVWFEFDPPTRFQQLCAESNLSIRVVGESE